AINDTEEIVVKPLGKQLKGLAAFAGATIMGDGRVALILDVLSLAQHARVVSDVRGRRTADPLADRLDAARAGDAQALLLFRVGQQQMAMRLSMVARLEEFPQSAIERAGDQDVVQYRGDIMPLVNLRGYFDASRTAETPAADAMRH